MNKYYVYVYLDPRKPDTFKFDDLVFDLEPFYVGKGTGSRFKSHLRHKGKHLKNHIIQKIRSQQMQPVIVKIAENLSETDALNLESKTIMAIGTRSKIDNVPIGPLSNLKLDGNCQKYSEASKNKMSVAAKVRQRQSHSEETKLKMSAIASQRTEEEKQRIANLISAACKGRAKSKEHSERMSKLHKGKILSEETKNRISKGLTGRKTAERTREPCLINKRKNGEYYVRRLMKYCQSTICASGVQNIIFLTVQFMAPLPGTSFIKGIK